MLLISSLSTFFTEIIWFAILHSRKQKSMATRVMAWMALISGIYFLADALALQVESNDALTTICSIICSCLAPTLPWIMLLYFWTLYTDHQKLRKSILWFFVIPLSNGLITTATFAMIGVDAAAEFIYSGREIPTDATTFEGILYMVFNAVTIYVYNIVISIGIICLLAFAIYVNRHTDYKFGDFWSFLIGKGGIKPVDFEIIIFGGIIALSAFRMSFPREFFLDNEWTIPFIYLMASFFVSLMGVVALKMDRPFIYLNGRKHLHFEDLPIHIYHNKTFDEADSDTEDFEDPFLRHADILDEEANALRNEFHVLMSDNELFLEQGMSRYRVCDFLNISTKKLDQFVMKTYGVTYQEYVQLQRVAYLERYNRVRPEDSPRRTAAACGFQSVREMHSLYKEIKGEPLKLSTRH